MVRFNNMLHLNGVANDDVPKEGNDGTDTDLAVIDLTLTQLRDFFGQLKCTFLHTCTWAADSVISKTKCLSQIL